MRAIIIAGGQLSEHNNGQRWVREGDLVVGADGGGVHALAWGLVPHLVIGDMDSLPQDAQAELMDRGCSFVVHPRAKDETDLELALSYVVQHGAREIVVLGALGGRLDHTLANILLLALPELVGVSVRIVGGEQEALLVRGGESCCLAGKPGDLVSLLPLGGAAHGVTTAGLEWALCGDTLHFGFTRGVSNLMAASKAEIRLNGGYLLVVHSFLSSD